MANEVKELAERLIDLIAAATLMGVTIGELMDACSEVDIKEAIQRLRDDVQEMPLVTGTKDSSKPSSVQMDWITESTIRHFEAEDELK